MHLKLVGQINIPDAFFVNDILYYAIVIALRSCSVVSGCHAIVVVR